MHRSHEKGKEMTNTELVAQIKTLLDQIQDVPTSPPVTPDVAPVIAELQDAIAKLQALVTPQ